jgi:serine/threonine-protein kinase
MKGIVGEAVLGGKYKIVEQIGRGGFGRVFRAHQIALQRDVAIKASVPEQRDNLVMRERFRREAVLVASLSHPNVVVYHEFGVDDDGDMILVMEYLHGKTLLEVIRNGEPLTAQDIGTIILEASRGLQAAHSIGIVHRDIKPSNLMMVSPERYGVRVKVIDFGILRLDPSLRPSLPDLTVSDVVVGTPGYLSPEALRGEPLDARADEYALALVALELLTGKRAFGGPQGMGETLMLRLVRPPSELGLLPRALKSVLGKALTPDPSSRFEDVLDFGLAFCDAVKESKIVVPVPDKRKRNRLFSLPMLTVLAVLAGVASGTVAAIFSRPEAQSKVEGLLPPIRPPSEPALIERLGLVEIPSLTAEHKSLEPVHAMKGSSRGKDGAKVQGQRPDEESYLTINARPWAQILIDGRSFGNTPLVKVPLRPGRHKVTFTHPTLGTRNTTVDLAPSQTLTLSQRLDED